MSDFATTNVDMANLALGHVAGREITSLTANQREAELCNRFFNIALSYVLSDHDWKFASKKAAGVPILLDQPGGPTTADLDGWQYMYAYPSDCAKVREILTASHAQSVDQFGFGYAQGAAYGDPAVYPGMATFSPSVPYTVSHEMGFGDQRSPEIPFNVAEVNGALYVFTDVQNARLRYTKLTQNAIAYPADFAMVFSYYLASLIAFPLSRKFELAGNMVKLYQTMKPEVYANNMNETTQVERDPPPNWIRSRQGD